MTGLAIPRACRVTSAGHARGFVLPLVLWLCALIALDASTLLRTSRITSFLVHRRADSGQAEASADAGIAMAIVGILNASSGDIWPSDGRIRTVQFGGARVSISAQDSLGLLDVNAAPAEVLDNLFRAAGVSSGESLAAAAAIVRWRGPPGQPERRLSSLDELASVPGVPADLFQRVRRFITVRNGTAAVDPVTAPGAVLRSVPGIPGWMLETFLNARARASVLAGTLPLLNDPETRGAPPRRYAVIRADAVTASGARFIREAEVELRPAGGQSYHILTWRRGPAEPG